MIDLERRKKLAFHLRHLSIGQISNDEFEENIINDVSYGWLPEQYHRAKEAKTDDPIIIPVLELCWTLYDDTKNHKVKLNSEDLKFISRIILFLHSGQTYDWPYFNSKNIIVSFSILDIIFTILSFGFHYRNLKIEQKEEFLKFQKAGDYGFWPFLKKENFEKALENQPFLKANLA